MRSRYFGTLVMLTVLLVAALPLAAQTPGGSAGLIARPPHQHIVTPAGIQPSAMTVANMRKAYGVNLVKNGGKGQTIALVLAFDNPNIEADFGVFNTKFKLPACTTANGCFKLIYQTGTKPPADTGGWSNEMAIDVEWAHAIAPMANIMVVEANSNYLTDMYAAVDVAVQNGANVVNMSWSAPEYSSEITDDSHFTVTGVTFVAASGDYGYNGGTQYPAGSPYVVAVGGTNLVLASGAWSSETAWSGSGGGISKYETEPSYQASAQTTGYRGIPDVAYDADPNTGVWAYSSYSCASCYPGWLQWGGTSIGAPQWSGIFAIANSMRVARGKKTLNQPHFLLYPAAATNYHDITSGTNGSCGATCTATVGYDFVTGLGSPQANLLIPKLVAAP